MIQVQNLTVGRVLRGVSFELPSDGCLGVVGLNGAGKSTLLALLAGVLPPDEGSLDVPTGAAYLPEGCPLDSGIRVRSWLQLATRLPGYEPAWAAELGAALPLDERTPAGRLSQGQRVRLGLRMTLARRAPAYLLDDPFLGLDPIARRAAESAIAERCAEAPVVLAAQDTGALERLCTHLLLLRGGEMVWCAPLEAWRERYRLLRIPESRRQVLQELGASVRSTTTRGAWLDVFVDDPDGAVARALGGEPVALDLADLIAEVAA